MANGLVMNIYYNKCCGIDIPMFWKNILLVSRGMIAPVLFGIVLPRVFWMSSFLRLLLGIFVYVLVYVCSMWLFGMNTYEKEIVLDFVKKIRNNSILHRNGERE